MSFPNFDLGVNDINVCAEEYLFDNDGMDDILMTISPTVLENKENAFPDIQSEIPKNQNEIIQNDEMHQSFDESENDEETDNPVENDAPPSKKFKDAADNLRNFVQGNRNKNTTRKTQKETDRFKRFLVSKKEPREIHHIPPEELDVYLGEFIKDLKKVNGEDYEPDSVSSFFRFVEPLNTSFNL